MEFLRQIALWWVIALKIRVGEAAPCSTQTQWKAEEVLIYYISKSNVL